MKTLALIAAGFLLAPGIAAAADLTGAWTITTNVNDMPFTIVCNMTQTGASRNPAAIKASVFMAVPPTIDSTMVRGRM